MDIVAWFLQIPLNPRSPPVRSNVPLSSLFLRSFVRPSEPDDAPWQKPSRSVTWSTHVELLPHPSRSVTWSSHDEVLLVPRRECAPNDCDLQCVISARDHANDDCASRASTTALESVCEDRACDFSVVR